MPSINLGNIITTTLRNCTSKLRDKGTNNNALLTYLNTKERINPAAGSQISQKLSYPNKEISRYDTAIFDFKQAAVGVSISGLEDVLQNHGKERVLDLLESRIEVAEETMKNLISTGIYSNGTAYGGMQIGGLQFLVSTTPTTGVVGGFDRANAENAFWRNQLTSFATMGLVPGSDTIQAAMNNLYLQTIRETDQVDLIIADKLFYRYLMDSMQSIQRIIDSNNDIGRLGFQSLKYMKADVVLDEGLYAATDNAGDNYSNVPTSPMYFLNTKYIHYRPHIERNMIISDHPRYSVNQDAEVRLILFAGNMTLSNASLQGVLTT
jgi:hypothetical protein